MMQPAWLTKWQAREALQNGQPEEAHRLLDELLRQGNRRAWALQADVIRGYVERAERALRQDQIESAWADLKRVETLSVTDFKVVQLRDTLTRLGIAEVRACLECGKPLQAIKLAAQLKEHGSTPSELPTLEEAAQLWLNAIDLADRGEFSQARELLEKVRERFKGRGDALDRFEERIQDRENQYRRSILRLTDSLARGDWKESIELADFVLTIAPQHRDVQQSRAKAWQAIQPSIGSVGFTPGVGLLGSTASGTSASGSGNPKRFLLWIDGIGSYLICLNPRVTIGQQSTESNVDIPLLADISRIHAVISREEEQYLLESGKGVTLNDHLCEKAVLASGDRIQVTRTCEFRFVLPMPGSQTARLETVSVERLPYRVNSVILMSQMLVIGPTSTAHLAIPLSQNLFLLRERDQFVIRWKGEFYYEGQRYENQAVLNDLVGAIYNDQFSFAIEPYPTGKPAFI